MTDQPNTEMDADVTDAMVDAGVEKWIALSGIPNDEATNINQLREPCREIVRAALSRRAVAPAPAGDVERVARAMKPDLFDPEKTPAFYDDLWANAMREQVRSMARAALAAMPSGRQRGEHPVKVFEQACDEIMKPGDDVWIMGEVVDWGATDENRQMRGAEGSIQYQDTKDMAIRTAAAQLGEPDDGWLLIASAPKDGKPVLTCRLGEKGVNICHMLWHPEHCPEGEWVETQTGRTTVTHHTFATPTHWRPLPPAPSVPR